MNFRSWLGLSTATPTKPPTPPASPTSTTNSLSFTPQKPTSTPSKQSPTRSDTLLKDLALLSFFHDLDSRLQNFQLLTPAELQRLEHLAFQANMDECDVLVDIVEYFEGFHWKVWSFLRERVHDGAGSDLVRAGGVEVVSQQRVC